MRIVNKSAFVIYVLMLMVGTLHAIDRMREPRFKTYSTEDGLSNDGVSCILEDTEGFIWFGTWDGLNRYDGNKFIVYKSRPGDRSHLRSNKIREVVEDKMGYLWVKTFDKKVYRFDKRKEEFLPVLETDKGERLENMFMADIIPMANGDVWLLTEDKEAICVSALPNGTLKIVNYNREIPYLENNVNFLFEGTDSRVWIGTETGLVCLIKGKGLYRLDVTSGGRPYGMDLNFTQAAEQADGHLFFATTTGVLVAYNPQSKAFTRKKIEEGPTLALLASASGKVYLTFPGKGLTVFDPRDESLQHHRDNGASFFSIYEDKETMVWLEPERDGVILYQPHDNTFHRFRHEKEHNLPFMAGAGAVNDGSFRVFEDVNNTVWVSLKGGGFGYYERAKNKLAYFYNNPADNKRLFSNNLVAAYSDKKGVLWFCTRNGGVHKATFFSDNFQYKRLVDHSSNRFDNEIRALLQDADGKIWITNKRGEVYYHKNGDVKMLESDQIPGSIYCITEDRNRNIWLGTKGYGLVKLEPKNEERTEYKVSRYEHDPADNTTLSSNQIYSITEDDKGRLWIGTFQKGPNLLLEENGKVHFKNINNSFKNYPKRTFQVIRHAIWGPDKRVWLGTTDGLLRFDPDENPDDIEFIPTVKVSGDVNSLGNNDITYLFESKDKTVWVATFGGGLNKVTNKADEFDQPLRFKSFTKEQGLPNDIVLSMVEDNSRSLWIATENGIAMMHPKTAEFRNYNVYNGLPKVDFSEAACLQARNGAIFFGCVDGYVSFYPDKIVNDRFPGNMVFTGIQLYNQDINIADPKSPLKVSVNYADEIILNHNQDVITIEYAVLDYRFPDDVSYAYILEGYDKDWHDVKNQKKATYTKIPPGHYTFRVKTAHSGHFENVPEKTLSIIVKKPWWLSSWALCCYAVLFLAGLELVRRVAFTMIRLKHKVAVEKKITELKLQFFTNISHELRTPLTLIVNPLFKLKQEERLSEKGRKYLATATRNTDRMMRFVNQLLDFRKMQADKLSLQVKKVNLLVLLRELLENFTDIAEDKQLSIVLSADEAEVEAWCDREKIDIVFFNIISNAVKFSRKKGKILIRVTQTKERILIRVVDEGHAVAEDQLKLIFEAYYEGGNTQDKAFKGTGIGLALSKDIIKLHGGELWAERNADVGMTFSISLLAGKAHFATADFAELDAEAADTGFDFETAGIVAAEEEGAHVTSLPKLLLVEDNPELRQFIAEEFRALYLVTVASNGVEGYAKAVEEMPDVIVSDVMMPEMDGIQLLEKIKTDERTSHIPIVLLTAKSSIEDQIKGLSYGADFYITKPFHVDYVRYLLRNLVQSRQQMVRAMLEASNVLKLEPSEVVITSKDEAFLKNVIEIIEREMPDTSFHIDVVVRAMAMGRTTFYKKLKSLTNMSPVEFIRDIRLKRAKQLLDSGELTVTEVAYKVGFNSSGYFSTCFKDKYAVSPSDYLKKATAQDEEGR